MTDHKNIKRTACVFGAGASFAYGIPTLNQLPTSIIEFIKECKSSHFKEVFTIVKSIVLELQGKDLEKEWIDYENLLGQLDYFIRNNSIIHVDNYLLNQDTLTKVFKTLTKIIFSAIDNKTSKFIDNTIFLDNSKELYKNFFDRLWFKTINDNNIPVLSTISFNYDCKLDDEYFDHIWGVVGVESNFNVVPHYIVPIYTFSDGAHLIRNEQYKWTYSKHHELIKLHGSFDWFKCPNCKTIHNYKIVNSYSMYYDDKHSTEEIRNLFDRFKCGICGAKLEHDLVAPILGKNENSTAKELWDGTFKSLIEAQEIIIIGYSFPQSDLAFLNLLQHALNWNRNKPIIKVVDPTSSDAHWEKVNQIFSQKQIGQLETFKGTFEEFIETYPNLEKSEFIK